MLFLVFDQPIEAKIKEEARGVFADVLLSILSRGDLYHQKTGNKAQNREAEADLLDARIVANVSQFRRILKNQCSVLLKGAKRYSGMFLNLEGEKRSVITRDNNFI